jgi:hypothetical protein
VSRFEAAGLRPVEIPGLPHADETVTKGAAMRDQRIASLARTRARVDEKPSLLTH